MPDLSEEVLKDIESRLSVFLDEKRPGSASPIYLASGGSAATYRVLTPSGEKAIKVYDPRFLAGEGRQAELRRLELQLNLIGHDCESLVAITSVQEFRGTAFIEMEYVSWPQLKKVLPSIPDAEIPGLIKQLVSAVVFLEQLEIVHRDIKPENIHVSPDFKRIKLLDLGVARTLSVPNEEAEDGTDHGNKRLFIATAQYSSPEYLFRLDAPSPTMWKALSIYQVGAVLHDLINKRPLFQAEVELGNRWLLARAVLLHVPSFPDTDPSRLVKLKALAARSLVKDINTRLQLVGWNDFMVGVDSSSLAQLQTRLAKERLAAGAQSADAIAARLQFEREGMFKRFNETVRAELIGACNQLIQISMIQSQGTDVFGCEIELALSNSVFIDCHMGFQWLNELHKNSATIAFSSRLRLAGHHCIYSDPLPVGVVTIGDTEHIVAIDMAEKIAALAIAALDMLNACTDQNELQGVNLTSLVFKGRE